jgi:hypothetical protein
MSKQIIQGKIDKIFVKDFGEADQYGNQYAVNVNIDGQWYGLGKKKKPVANIKQGAGWHQLAEGDVIEAVCETVERGGRTYNNIKSSDVTLKEAGNGGSGNLRTTGGGSGAGPVRNASASVGGDDRQAAIMRQSAMGYAAQIVAATLTSKSSLDQAAEDVLRIADQFFVPYAEKGSTAEKEKELENQQEAAQAATEEDFNDDIPF